MSSPQDGLGWQLVGYLEPQSTPQGTAKVEEIYHISRTLLKCRMFLVCRGFRKGL